MYTREIALASASRCSWEETVRYDGRQKNSTSFCTGAGEFDDGTKGAILKASPAPSESFEVRIGVCA